MTGPRLQMTAPPSPDGRGFWASFKRRARLKIEDLSRWPTTFRFPTDCKDVELLDVVGKRASQSRVIREVRLVPGRRGAIDIEVEIFENHDAARARSELKSMLPPGVSLIGGPTWGAGGGMG